MTPADRPTRPAPRPARWSPVDMVATVASRYARPPGECAEGTVPPRGRLRRWADGVHLVRSQRADFARHWQEANERACALDGPLWVVLGDSTAQGLGAATPDDGYVGQVLRSLTDGAGEPWRVINLSCSGAIAQDVLGEQLPRLAALGVRPDLVTCGVGSNDVLRTPLPSLRRTLRAVAAGLPAGAGLLDLGVPERLARGYVLRINREIGRSARDHGLRLVEVSHHFTAPWEGKFGPDHFHPSEHGYRCWARAILEAVDAPGSYCRPEHRERPDAKQVTRPGNSGHSPASRDVIP